MKWTIVILLALIPSIAIGGSLIDNLSTRSQSAGVLALEADGNGQTYFIHFATGKKYYTGQVSAETGQAFADNKAWIGMTKADLATIQTAGSTPQETLGELPETHYTYTDSVQQGIYGTCVAMSVTRSAEEVYRRATGNSIQFSELQFFTESGGSNVGVSIFTALSILETAGLVEEQHRPYDPTPWTFEQSYITPMTVDAPRYKFKAETIIGQYTQSERQIDLIKRGVLKYGHLIANTDTIRDWDSGASYPDNREVSINHTFIISGWDEDGWIIHNSYGEPAGWMRYDYPMLWVHGLKML